MEIKLNLKQKIKNDSTIKLEPKKFKDTVNI